MAIYKISTEPNKGIEKRLEIALYSFEPEKQLIQLVEELKIEGWNQLQIYDVFEKFMFSLEAQGKQAEGDTVTEVFSYIYGWCPSNLKLFPHNLSNDEIIKYRESKN